MSLFWYCHVKSRNIYYLEQSLVETINTKSGFPRGGKTASEASVRNRRCLKEGGRGKPCDRDLVCLCFGTAIIVVTYHIKLDLTIVFHRIKCFPVKFTGTIFFKHFKM